jgi:hypothetical protein
VGDDRVSRRHTLQVICPVLVELVDLPNAAERAEQAERAGSF